MLLAKFHDHRTTSFVEDLCTFSSYMGMAAILVI